MKKLFLLIAVMVTMLPNSLVAQSRTLRPLKDDKKGLYGYGYGYRKNNGNYIFEIKPKFEKASEFSDRYAFVRVKGLWGQIYKNGKYAIKPTFNWNLDDVHALSRGLFSIHQGKKIGVMDDRGKKILPCVYDAVSVCNRHELIVYRKNGLYGVANTNGTILIPPVVIHTDNIQELKEKIDNNVAFTMLSADGKCYVIEEGKVISFTEYVEYQIKNNVEYAPSITPVKAIWCNFKSNLDDWGYRNEIYFEEEADGSVYSHICTSLPTEQKYYNEIISDLYIFAPVKHQVNKKHYMCRKNVKTNTTQKFCFNDLFKIDGRFTATSMSKLSNGDYIIETSNVRTRFEGNLFPGYQQYVRSFEEYIYFMERDIVFTSTSTTKYLIIVDHKTFKPKVVIPHPGDSALFGMSQDGGWYMMDTDKYYDGSVHCTIYKYNNRGKAQWVYHAPSGETVKDIYESSSYTLLSGSTTNKGYIGFENPLLVYLNIKTGEREHEQHITKKAKRATLEEHAKVENIKIYDKEQVVKVNILNVPAYGLWDCYGNWIIQPVVVGSEKQTYGDWIISSPQVDETGGIIDDATKCVVNKRGEHFTVKETNR